MKARGVALAAVLVVVAAPPARAADAPVAALQVKLRAAGLYGGPVDGLPGPLVADAVRAFQQRAGLAADGVAGPQTRAALGARRLGSRDLGPGNRGWDVAELQFLLAWRGFPSARFGTAFGEHLERAVRRFQRSVGLADDGVVGPATLAALRLPPPAVPIRLAWPLQAPVGDGFGPRGDRFHAGIDLKAATGTPVAAAAAGRVTWAGELGGGWGLLVVVAHGQGTRTLYAHLSRIDVVVGQQVGTGRRLGLVGSTGDATGPHLHFGVRVHGAAVDPLPALP
ncbi:MAG TPA: peptidoglycan-binding protein [Gaiellaceae bacterium]|jgi:murein DD-endopeptidase MepM/ murein hydrolase activator NlpD|nr:peptidoglycan-binding protein [Gaiellaceae bacterium]